jgi:hypothetical protein
MIQTQHFFVLYRPDRPHAVWHLDVVRRTLSRLRLRPEGMWHVVASGPLLVGWLGGAKDVGDSRAPFLLYAGDLAEPDWPAALGPDWIARLAADPPTRDFPLDGAFCALAVDPVSCRAAVCTDRFGLFPCYRLEHAGAYAFATSLALLTALTRPSCRLNRAAVYEMIGFHLVLGNRTFLQEIELVPPASVVRIGGAAGLASDAYWDWGRIGEPARQTGSRRRDDVHETYAMIEQAVLRSVRGAGRVGLGLSGGLDSRMLAAVLARNGVPCHAYNMDFGRETPIARQVASTLRIPLRVLPVLAAPARTILAGHEAIDCQYDVNQTWGGDMAEQAARDGCDVFLDGLAFDAILGTVHRVAGADVASLSAGLKGYYQEIGVKSLGRVTGTATAARIQESWDDSIRSAARDCLENAEERASDYFLMVNRIRRYTFGFGLANLYHLPGRYPYVTRALFDHCMRLPLEQRQEHRLYRRIYCELFPDLARIPWAKSNRPLDKFGRSPESSRPWHILAAAVRRLSRGRLQLPGSSSLLHEFRVRPELREPFLRRLRRPTMLGTTGCIPEQTILRLFHKQQAGYDYLGLLQALFTVENFLVRFVKDGVVRLQEQGGSSPCILAEGTGL